MNVHAPLYPVVKYPFAEYVVPLNSILAILLEPFLVYVILSKNGSNFSDIAAPPRKTSVKSGNMKLSVP